MASMRLTPWEEERLLIFTAAELARRHRAAGLALNAPEAIALICDAMLEAARAGASYADVEAAGLAAVAPGEVMPGVRELVDDVRLEVLMDDGTRLIVPRRPARWRRGRATVTARGRAAGRGTRSRRRVARARDPRAGRAQQIRARRSGSARTSRSTASTAGSCSIAPPRAGFRLDLAAGASERWGPGETRTVRLVRFGGEGGEA